MRLPVRPVVSQNGPNTRLKGPTPMTQPDEPNARKMPPLIFTSHTPRTAFQDGINALIEAGGFPASPADVLAVMQLQVLLDIRDQLAQMQASADAMMGPE